MSRAPTVLLAASSAAFVLVSAAAGSGLFAPFDRWALRMSQKAGSGALDNLGTVFSFAGSVEVAGAALVLLAAALFFSGRRRIAARLLAAFVATGVIEVALKFMLPSPPLPGTTVRAPDPTFLVALEHPFPYPSGHALRLVLLFGAVFVLWNNRIARVVVAVGLAGTLASRVYLGVHWASDVIGGGLLGIVGLSWVFMRAREGA